jgi:hypothetical protein
MKKWKYLSSFVGLMALCVVVGLGSQGKPPHHDPIEVKIMVAGEPGEEEIKLKVEYPEGDPRPSDTELIWAYYDQEINWTSNNPGVIDYVIFFGGNSPMGAITPRGEVEISSELRPEVIKGNIRRVGKKVLHNPSQAGGRHSKYYIAVYYKHPDAETPRLLFRDPDIIIPPRGGRR